MPVSHALKLKLVQQFQQQKALEAVGAQGSRAERDSREDQQPQCSADRAPTIVHQPSVTAGHIATEARQSLENAQTAHVVSGEGAPSHAEPRDNAPVPPKRRPAVGVIGPGPASKAKKIHAAEHASDGRINGEYGAAASKDRRTGAFLSSEPGLPLVKKKSNAPRTPLDIMRTPGTKAEAIGSVNATCCSYSELWTAVTSVCGIEINRTSARLVYQDAQGDWMALQADAPFTIFTACGVKRLLVVCGK